MPDSAELRICSLLPSSTEIIYLLELEDRLVGVSHECNYPAEALKKPRITKSFIPSQATSAEIDRMVTERLEKGELLYEIDMALLKKIRPNLIITQQLCDVCAISYNSVARAAHDLKPAPEILSLTPGRFEDIYEDIVRIGEATGCKEKAVETVNQIKKRVRAVISKTETIKKKPSVLCMEWFDPPYCAGHWMPEMVSLAGGKDEFGILGEDSKVITWESIVSYNPDMIVLVCSGWTVEQTLQNLDLTKLPPDWSKLKAVKSKQVTIVDANYFTRPGPRIVEGLEILAKILHPDLFPQPAPANTIHRM